MKSPLFRYIFLPFCSVNLCHGALIMDFESYGAAGSNVVGQGGTPPNVWSINDATDQYSQIANSNANPTDPFTVSKALNLGDASAVTTAPTGPNVTMSYPSGGTVGATSLMFDFVIVDSLTGSFPNRDRFSISFSNGLTNVFAVYFVPRDTDLVTPGYQNSATPGSGTPAQWDLHYQIGNSATVPLNLGVLELSQYRFDLQFQPNANPSLSNFDLSITSAIPNSLSDDRVDLSLDPNTTFSHLNVGWLKMDGNPYGSNSIVIDNINLVPEPSSALLLGLAGLGFVTRRKRA